jgi:hypothetical protein
MIPLKEYINRRNITDDFLIDKIERFYSYFKLSLINDYTIRMMFIDIAVEFGEGYVFKTLNYLSKKSRTLIRGKVSTPDFKEEYAMHYLNTKDTYEQFLFVIRALFNIVEASSTNYQKLKKIVELFFEKVGGYPSYSSKNDSKVIGYV